MTVSSLVTYPVQFNCDGATVDFDFDFGVSSSADIEVIITDEDDAETILVITTNYTVAATNDDYSSGGTVTTVATYALGNVITICLAVDINQESDFTENQATLYETFEDGLDKLTRISQQLDEWLGRALSLPKSSGESGDGIVPLPSAGKALQWNTTEDGLENSTVTVDDVSTAVTAAEAAQTAAEAAQTAAEEAQAAAEVAQAAAEAAAGYGAAQSATVVSGVLTLGNAYSWWKVDGEGGVDDSITSIAGVSVGKVVELTPIDDVTTLILENGTALKLMGGSNCILNNQYDCIALRCISTGPIVMREISRMNGGS